MSDRGKIGSLTEALARADVRRLRRHRAGCPCICRVAHGIAAELEHAERLHLLGNGVVPQQAARAFTTLWYRLTSG